MPNLCTTPVAAAVAFSLLACAFAVGDELQLYAEKYRPQFHFTAKKDWLNDPNGLVYFDGEYHLFFQRRVGMLHSDGNMTWGHAVSADLFHWRELPDAIMPDDAGSIWSGSAVVDWHNTSGFGTGGKPPLVAMYTRAKAPFAQCLAYSNDKGRTWTKFAGNPVIPNLHEKNRDPKLIWHEATRRWVVAIYLDQPHQFELFTSPDLKQWTPLQTITLDGDDECPDFFPLPLDGDASKTKWVFTAANARYIVGTFGVDGMSQIPAYTPDTDALPAERGSSFYAAQTYSDTPDSRRIQIGWLRRDGEYPGMPFNQQMSIPAELTLRATPNGPRLFRWPAKEIENLYGEKHEWHEVPLTEDKSMLGDITGELFDIDADIELAWADSLTLTVRGQPITYHAEGGGGVLECLGRRISLRRPNGRLQLRIIVDRTSAEIFANGGETVLSCCFLPDEKAKPLKLSSKGGVIIESLVVREMNSAWGPH